MRQIAEVKIAGELLLEILKKAYPEWLSIQYAEFHHAIACENSGAILLRVTNNEYAPVAEGAPIPRLYFCNETVLRLPFDANRFNR